MTGFDGVAIVGAAEVAYRRKATDASTLGLLRQAFQQAIGHAGVEHRAVDGVAVASFTLRPDHAIDVAWQLGLSPRWCMEDSNGGASGINMLQHAARAIQAGDAETIVILAGDHFQPGDFKDLVENYNATTRDHLAPLGFGGPNAPFALLTQRHARAHGLVRDDYAAVCIAQREWARRNPNAVYRSALTLEEYRAAPFIAEPLCRYDCVPVVSGANALVLTAATRQAGSVRIRALAARHNPDHQEGDGLRTGLAGVAPALWQAAASAPQDMDLALVYDDYPAMVLAQLSDLGFIGDGDVRRFIHDRVASHALPVNTSGGQLSAGQAGAAAGLHGLVEAVVQLRGQAGARAGGRGAAGGGIGLRHGGIPLWHVRQRRRAGGRRPMSVGLFACDACGHVCFPARQLCHRCGGGAWTTVPAERGVVEEATAVLYQTDAERAGPCHLASVRTEAGVTLLVRLDQPARPGQAVALRLAGPGAVLGRPLEA